MCNGNPNKTLHLARYSIVAVVFVVAVIVIVIIIIIAVGDIWLKARRFHI